MSNFALDFSAGMLTDSVWLVYDSAAAIASVLSSNFNLHGILNFLENYKSVVADTTELLETLLRLVAQLTK